MLQLTPAVRNLLLINLAIFGLPYVLDAVAGALGFSQTLATLFSLEFSADVGVLSVFKRFIVRFLGLYKPASDYFLPTQLLTAAFVHTEFFHLLFNMFGLFLFGPLLESVLGTKRFISFYLISAIGASLIHIAVGTVELRNLRSDGEEVLQITTPDNVARFMSKHDYALYRQNDDWFRRFSKDKNNQQYIDGARNYVEGRINEEINVPMIGASGAVMALIMVFGLLFPNTELMLLFPPIPVKAKYVVAGYVLYDIYSVIKDAPDDHVAHYAHLGGAIFGWIFVMYWRRNSTTFY